MTRPDVVLGVEIGAAVITVAVLGEDLDLRETVAWPLPRTTHHPVDPAQDPWLVLDTLASAVREAAGVCEVFGNRVRGLSLTSRLPSLLALDAGYLPLTPALTATDGRSVGTIRRLVAEQGSALHRLTGVPLTPASPVAKLAWFAGHDPGLFGHAAHWTGLKGFLLSRLTGRLVTDVSTSSAAGWVESATLDWAQPALDVAGVHREQLPDLVEATTVLRLTAAAGELLGLPPGTPVVVGASGAATTQFGVGAMDRGCAALSMGATADLCVLEDGPVVPESDLVSCHAFADGLWISRGTFSNGDAVARWAAESFGGVDIDVLLAEAEQVPIGAEGLIGIPQPAADATSWGNPDFQAALVGLRVEHGRAAMTRAMAEGVARELATVRAAFGAITRVRAAGSALRSPLWASLLAAALDVPLEVVGTDEAPAVGAALMAWRGLGLLGCLCDRPGVRLPAREVLPDPLAAAHFAATRRLGEQLTRLLTQLRTAS
ncbi:FGGY family carbohydrate kinase [Amycolatopsis tolypomycina]|uniref:Gluconate kinase, FGGY family n=1 Tax=Amycolatopsis tolypomycina TaxID=208445 RepID=A0A1H4T1I6_9PSEU|nr:FGGY family carbohydrate kinase [Amycolatopsis tolypomycina]SEC50168.1 gluconate kinase, FGGY family [Amycolatopsis tolypomycina]